MSVSIDEKLKVALDTTSDVFIMQNAANGVSVGGGNANPAQGVTITPVLPNQYFCAQIGGNAPLLFTAAITAGTNARAVAKGASGGGKIAVAGQHVIGNLVDIGDVGANGRAIVKLSL